MRPEPDFEQMLEDRAERRLEDQEAEYARIIEAKLFDCDNHYYNRPRRNAADTYGPGGDEDRHDADLNF